MPPPRLLSLVFALFATAMPLPAQTDPPGTIVLAADAAEGVTLVGKAKIGKPAAPPEQIERVGMTGQPIVLLGTWSKPNPDECRAEFAPKIPRDGYYEVYIRWFSAGFGGGQSKSLPVRVVYDGGTRSFSFGMNSGSVWAYLGIFPFKAGDSGRVIADAQGSMGASNINAVKLVPVADPKAVLAARERVLPVKAGAQDEFDKMRVRVARLLTPNVEANVANPLLADYVAGDEARTYLAWKTIQRGAEIQDLWTDLPERRPFERNEGSGPEPFNRIADLAAAYVGSNAPLGFAAKMQGNPELLADIVYALTWMHEKRYNENSKNKMGADWISREIINPLRIAQTLLLLHPRIPEDLLQKEIATMNKQSPGPDKYYGSFISTGFNRLFGVYAFAQRAILTKDAAALDRINTLIEEEYQINNRSNPMVRKGAKAKQSQDGYYADGSFIQHAHFPYIGIYGRGMLGVYAQLQSLLAGSRWEIRDPRSKIFFDWVYRGYAPLFFGGEIMYGSLGRSTGQSWHQNGRVSTEIMDALVKLVPDAPPADKARLSAIFKAWLVDKEQAAYPEFSRLTMDKLSPETFGMLMAIKNDPAIQPERPAEGTTVFHNTDYVVHHQRNFAVQLRMFSTRIKTHEDINEGTNRLGWYQGEGTLFLYDRDNSRYHDNFWATVNPYRLPGITVDPRPRETPGSKDGQLSTSPWAGGVAVGSFGMASMGLAAVDATLTAQKSWFFFGDQIVCLGSAIRSSDNRPIETVVENTKLHGEGDRAFVVNGTMQPSDTGWSADLKGVQWANLAGKVAGTDVGWVFPGGADLKALREARTGSWTTSFVKDADGAEHRRTYLTLWYDHGPNPTGATYAYVLLPGRTADQTRAYAEKPGVEIVENSALAQTVSSPGLGVIGANFWTAAPHRSGGISSSGKAAVVMVEKGGKLTVGIADPTQLEKQVEITLPGKASKAVRTDEKIQVLSLDPLKLSVDLTASDGRTLTAEFER